MFKWLQNPRKVLKFQKVATFLAVGALSVPTFATGPTEVLPTGLTSTDVIGYVTGEASLWLPAIIPVIVGFVFLGRAVRALRGKAAGAGR